MRVEVIGKIMARLQHIMCATVRAISVRLPVNDRIRQSAGRSCCSLRQARKTLERNQRVAANT